VSCLIPFILDGGTIRNYATPDSTCPPKHVHAINHRGTYYSVPGIQLSEPSPQRTPLPFEAGNSTRGTASLAQHKECTFVSSPSKQVVKHYADDTSAAAHAKYQQYRQHIDKDASLAPLSGWTSVDFSTQPLDATLD